MATDLAQQVLNRTKWNNPDCYSDYNNSVMLIQADYSIEKKNIWKEIYVVKKASEKTIHNLEILKESGGYFEDDEVEVRYEDLEENCVVETTRKWYRTKRGRYINIKGKRYYIDNKYRYRIDKKGDDFDFSNLRVLYYDHEYGYLVLKPINKLRIGDFKTLLNRNNLNKDIQFFDEENLWNMELSQVWYEICTNRIKLPLIDYCDVIEADIITNNDKKILESLKNKYFKDKNIDDDGCRCVYCDGFYLRDQEDFEWYDDWAVSVGLI